MREATIVGSADLSIKQYLQASYDGPKSLGWAIRSIGLKSVIYDVCIKQYCNKYLTNEFKNYVSLFDKSEYLPDAIHIWVANTTKDLWEKAKMGDKVNGKENIEIISTDELIQTLFADLLFSLSKNHVLIAAPVREIFGNIFNIFEICHRHRINTEVRSEIKEKSYARTNPFLELVDIQATNSLHKHVIVPNICKALIREMEIDPDFQCEGCLVMDSEGNIKFVKDFEQLLYRNEISTSNIINVHSIAGYSDERADLETKMYDIACDTHKSYLTLCE